VFAIQSVPPLHEGLEVDGVIATVGFILWTKNCLMKVLSPIHWNKLAQIL
jgi:hypothetical protein